MHKFLRQIIRFIGVSGIGWIIDFSLYNVLALFFRQLDLINVLSSLAAVCFVFWTSVRTAFKKNRSQISLRWKFAIYILYQLVLIALVSKLLLSMHLDIQKNLTGTAFFRFSAVIAKVLVTPITMITNFFVMKILVEKI